MGTLWLRITGPLIDEMPRFTWGQAEPGRVGGNPDVGPQGHARALGKANAIDRGDYGLPISPSP